MGTGMASSTSAVSSSSAPGKEAEINDLLQHLDLRDDELEEVVIGTKEVQEFQKDARWLAIGKVHTNRSFSSDALFGKMKAVWKLESV